MENKSIYDEVIEIMNPSGTATTQEELAINNLFDIIKEEYILLLTKSEYNLIIKALQQAKQLEKDIERYLEVTPIPLIKSRQDEVYKLYDKLLKVGKEK